MESPGEIIRRNETDYLRGTTQRSRYVSWQMHDTIDTIEAYLNSKHTTGEFDSLNREKPFFNIVTAAVNIWYRATDIDRKNIKFVPKNSKSVVLAFVANVILQNWMTENRLGVFLNEWGRSLAGYGSSVVKFVKNSSGLHSSVISWNNLIVDPVEFEPNVKIEVLELTEAQLRQRITNNKYNKEQVEALVTAVKQRETLDKQRKDNKTGYIKLYELHGELPLSFLTDKEADEDTYVQQMHVISYVGKRVNRTTEYTDFTLYKGKESVDPYMITHLIREEGRSLSIGAVEHLFQAQWMTNHSIKTMKDTLDLSSRLILQTADSRFVGSNVLDAIESGDIMIHSINMPLTKVDLSKPDIVSLQNYAVAWQNLAQEITATPDAMRGNNAPSGTPYSTTALLTQQSNSLFELMTENKGLAIEDMMRKFIIPYIKTKLKHKDEIVAILDQEGIQEIDLMYIPNEAARRYNAKAKNDVLNGAVPSPYQADSAMRDVQKQMLAQGNKRFFVPSQADDMTWADLFSDFEWDSIQVEVTNEQTDKQAVLQVLNTVLSTIGSNPAILQNPNAMMILGEILNQTGVISPIQLTNNYSLPPMLPHTTLRENVDFKDLPPDAKVQLLEKMGIQVQPAQSLPAPNPGGALIPK